MLEDNDGREIREYPPLFELREAQAVGVGRMYRYLEGRAVPYDTWGDVGLFMEQHASGSFERSTRGGAGKNVPLLMFHEQRSWPIGKAESWKHYASLSGVWKLADSDEAQRAARAAANGELGMSVGFLPVHTRAHKVPSRIAPELGPEFKPWLIRDESKLIEVSLTPVPVYDSAQVVMVRSRYNPDEYAAEPIATPDLDAWRAELDAVRSREH